MTKIEIYKLVTKFASLLYKKASHAWLDIQIGLSEHSKASALESHFDQFTPSNTVSCLGIFLPNSLQEGKDEGNRAETQRQAET